MIVQINQENRAFRPELFGVDHGQLGEQGTPEAPYCAPYHPNPGAPVRPFPEGSDEEDHARWRPSRGHSHALRL